MPLVLNALLCVAFAAAVGGAVHLWRRHNESARREALRAMAARRGWALTETGARLGRAGSLRVVPRGGPPWSAEVAGGAAIYDAGQPRWADGTLVLWAAGREGADAAARLGPAWARRAAALDPVAAPAGVVALAWPDPSLRVDLADLGRALRGWPGEGPAMLLGPEGLSLRLPRRLDRADRLEAFIDLAHELGRLVRP